MTLVSSNHQKTMAVFQRDMSDDIAGRFEAGLAQGKEDVRAAQALRYAVFVTELGADGPLVDHDQGLERDRFDDYADQLILKDLTRPEGDQVIGAYRLMDHAGASAAGGFYTEQEYDLTPLLQSGRPVLELGRSCLHPDYRGGIAMVPLWQALAQEIAARKAEVLFGVASFHGTDLERLSAPLSLLHKEHLAPPPLRVRSRTPAAYNLAKDIDKVQALRQVPALIKAYLRLGGYVGEGAFVDQAFNTTDVCLILDTAAMNPRQRAIYSGAGGPSKRGQRR